MSGPKAHHARPRAVKRTGTGGGPATLNDERWFETVLDTAGSLVCVIVGLFMAKRAGRNQVVAM